MVVITATYINVSWVHFDVPIDLDIALLVGK